MAFEKYVLPGERILGVVWGAVDSLFRRDRVAVFTDGSVYVVQGYSTRPKRLLARYPVGDVEVRLKGQSLLIGHDPPIRLQEHLLSRAQHLVHSVTTRRDVRVPPGLTETKPVATHIVRAAGAAMWREP